MESAAGIPGWLAVGQLVLMLHVTANGAGIIITIGVISGDT